MTQAHVPTRAGAPSLWKTGVTLLRLTWARTFSPLLIIGSVGFVLLPMLFAMAFASRGPFSGDAVPFLIARYDELVCALATPLLALLFGTTAFNAEAEDGTLLYLVTTTTPRWWIAVVRIVFAGVSAGLLSALAIRGTGYLAQENHDPEGLTRAFAIAGAFGGFVYASFFTALALYTKRALVVGLGYVLFWEAFLSTTFPGVNYLSVRQWMLAIAAENTTATDGRLDPGPSSAYAIGAGVVTVLLAVIAARRKLSRPRVERQ